MLQEQVISLNFGQGLDTKSDSKAQIPGRPSLLENAIFTQSKRISKRNGYTSLPTTILGGGNLVAPNFLKNFSGNADELVCGDQGRFYAFSQDIQAWVDKGKYVSVSVSDGLVSKAPNIQAQSCGGTLNNIALFAWVITDLTTVLYSVLDLTTNTFLATEQVASTGFPSFFDPATPKIVALGSTALALFYLNSSEQLSMKILTVNSSTASLGSEIVIGSDICDNGDIIIYDVVSTPTGAAVAYGYSTAFTDPCIGIKLKKIDTAGTVLNTTTFASNTLDSLTLRYDSNTQYDWIYWSTSSNSFSTTDLNYAIWNNGSWISVLATTALEVASLYRVKQLTSYVVDNTHQTLVFTQEQTVSVLAQTTVNTSGSGTSITTHIIGHDLYSKAFKVGTKNYVTMVFISDLQPTLFVIDLSDFKPVAKGFINVSEGQRTQADLSDPFILNSTQVYIPGGFKTQLESQNGRVFSLIGTAYLLVDFNNAQAYQGIDVNDTLILNGSIMHVYDGQQVVELGFNEFPEQPTAVVGGGGNIADGTYQYFIVYQWVDAQGNVYLSTPSIGKTVVVSGHSGTATITVTMPNLWLTEKSSPASSVTISVYRTANAGSTAYLVTSVSHPIVNDPLATFSTLNDGARDSDIIGNQILYTTGGVLENTSPVGSMVLLSHNNRIWTVDTENPNVISYSKTITPGTGVSFSDLLTVQEDLLGGSITGLGSMDDKLVVFKKNRFFYHSGDGANDLGVNSSLSFAQNVPSDTGCNNHRSIITFPSGIMAQSDKGIYLLDRSLSYQYIGAAVESFNNQFISQSNLISDKNQIRFLTKSGSSLLFDYFFNQWSSFTNHQGYAADSWLGKYCYVRTDGKVFVENITAFLDDTTSYSIRITFPDVKFQNIQGFQRIRRLSLLGDFTNGGSGAHKVQVSFAYNFSSTFTTPVPYSLVGLTNGPFQYRERLPIQKCDSVSFLIEEVISSGVSGEYLDLTDIDLEVGVKKGITKLQASQTVG